MKDQAALWPKCLSLREIRTCQCCQIGSWTSTRSSTREYPCSTACSRPSSRTCPAIGLDRAIPGATSDIRRKAGILCAKISTASGSIGDLLPINFSKTSAAQRSRISLPMRGTLSAAAVNAHGKSRLPSSGVATSSVLQQTNSNGELLCLRLVLNLEPWRLGSTALRLDTSWAAATASRRASAIRPCYWIAKSQAS